MIIWEDRNLPSWPWRKGCNNFAIFLQCLTPMWPSRLPRSNKWFNTLRKILHQQENCWESVRAQPRPNYQLKISLIWYESRCWLLSIVWWPVMSSPISSSRLVTVAFTPVYSTYSYNNKCQKCVGIGLNGFKSKKINEN